MKLPGSLKTIVLFLLFFTILLSACVKQTRKVENLWADLNITFLKAPRTLNISIYKQNQFASKLSEIEQKAHTLQMNTSGADASYWKLNEMFAKFLRKKLTVLQSRQAWQLSERTSFDINTASLPDCNRLLSFEKFSDRLKDVIDLAQKNNLLLNGFIHSYSNADKYNVERFRTDVTGLTKILHRAELTALLGKECVLYLNSKKFFENLTIDATDCNALKTLAVKVSEVEVLVADAKQIMEKLANYGADVKPLLRSYSQMKNALAELKELYRDLNSC